MLALHDRSMLDVEDPIETARQGVQLLEEEIDVDNGLRQGCTLTPVLFKIYACLVFERWATRVADMEGVGIYLRFKYDQLLFRRYTRNAQDNRMTECQFADDAAV